jgi:hypothetical protein
MSSMHWTECRTDLHPLEIFEISTHAALAHGHGIGYIRKWLVLTSIISNAPEIDILEAEHNK